ncbi:hypothetical protein H634G_03059 [Metarhizium anisopliae BRIP 53293]|uniref:Mid2 domain-containing protein n=1 Tax=Metarhizium anisopliae BRIP 53293 TaxID=1291518 RepID=A0A0D9P6S9_METAN|nr:hypothetical protein H634G_03059 [Metarhizium anisopliae BRIP 53293]KJK94304.1 hypothetical protein H633G_01882 [Metarhizium anisopliae BRIP 53284]
MITAGFVAVALAGLASLAENAAPFQAPDTYSLNGAGLANGFDGLAARDDECLASQAACGTGFCMPRGGSCCDRLRGTYCDVGFYCYPQGCCPSGKVCRGSPTDGCASGKQECGSVCIASSSVCCNPGASSDNVWCEYPKTCGVGGKCVDRALVTSASAVPSSTLSSLGIADATGTGGSSTKATGDSGDGSSSSGSSNDNSSSKSDKKTPVGAIVGGVVGGLTAIALVGVGILLLLRHKRKQKDAAPGQNMQPPPHQPLMQQYPPQISPYAATVSPAQGMGYPPAPPGSPPPPQGYYNASPPPGQYSPSMATGQVSSPTGTYSTSTDPRTGAPTVSPVGFATVSATPPPPPPPPPASQGHNGNEKPVVYEMSAKPGDDHRGNIHELG